MATSSAGNTTGLLSEINPGGAVERSRLRRQWRSAGTNYATTFITRAKGNLVFNAGTCWWNMVLSSPPGFMTRRASTSRNDARIQRITKNILDRMINTKLIE